MARKRKNPELMCGFCGKPTGRFFLPKGQKYIFCCKECLENYRKTPEYREAMVLACKKTCLEKYGVDNWSKTEEAKEKHQNYLKNLSEEQKVVIQQKKEETNLEKYGDREFFRTEEFKKKSRETKLEKYSDELYNNRPKVKETLIENFGSEENAYKHISIKSREKIEIKNRQKREERLKYIEDNFKYIRPYGYDLDDKKHLITFNNWICSKGHSFIRNYSDVVQKGFNHCPICFPHHSWLEGELIEFLGKLNIKYSLHYRPDWLKGLELDIFIPDFKLAIECNGFFYHSDLYKNKLYHFEKTRACLENGINLIHIFDVDWIRKSNIIKNIIKSKLNLNTRVFARKCSIRELDSKTCREFLDLYHFQGSINSKYKIGLFYNNELVQVMCFNKAKEDTGCNFELSRLCSKENLTIVGGASKLFKYLIKDKDNIITYSDRIYSSGSIYRELGFKYIRTNPPAYFHVKNFIKYTRFQTNRKALKKLLGDKFNTELTEQENLNKNGFLCIWDSGKDVWIYKK